MRWVLLALLLGACAAPQLKCYPKVRVYHEHRQVTGALAGIQCGTKGLL